jgi:hypothetical protein
MSMTGRDYTENKDQFIARLAGYDQRLQMLERGHVHLSGPLATTPILAGYQDHYQGSKNPGTYDSTRLNLPAPTVDANLFLWVGGHHGFGGAAGGTMNFTVRRGDTNQDLYGSGTLQNLAATSTAIPTSACLPGGTPIACAAGQVISIYFHYVVGTTNNYFAPKIMYQFFPKA